MSDIIYFEKNTERGSFIFKLKSNNDKNITIDKTIPTRNHDGWYVGNDVEWDKYIYSRDFQNYIARLNNYSILF